MMKKSLIAIALMAFLATTVQAGDLAENPIKFDEPTEVYWPWEYVALEICQIPVTMKVGMYVKMTNCGGRSGAKIELKQINCDDFDDDTKEAYLPPSIRSGGFPCYWDCTEVKLVANFDVKLGYKLYEEPGVDILRPGKWDAYYKNGDDVYDGMGSSQTKILCVAAWEAQIQNQAPGDNVKVGEVAVTVKPNA